MNANQFKDVIRKLVSEEVQKQLPKLLFEMLGNNTNKSVIRESTPTVSNNNIIKKQPVVTQPQQVRQQPVQPKPQKRYASNPVLNQILNEITPGLPQANTGESVLDGVMAPMFDKIGSNESFNVIESETNESSMKQLMTEGIVTDNFIDENIPPIEPIAPVTIPSDIKSKLFNRDFSAILKKSKNPGMSMNSGRVGMME